MVRRPALHDRVAAGILDTAARVLAERGTSVSMAEIAEAAGVGRATLYRYFPTREALLRGLVTAALAELRERIADAELDAVPVPEGIARLARAFLTAGVKYVALVSTGKHPDDAEEADRMLAGPVRDLLARGVADGTLRADLGIGVLVEFFGGMLEKSLQLVMRGELRTEQASAAVASMFLDGARARDREPA